KGELTLEHVPPESLGGKGIILTAKEINSRHGSANDKKLLQYINTRYFIEGAGSLPVYFSSEECRIKGLKLDLLIDKKEKGLSFSASERHISVLDKMGIFKNWDGSKMKFSGKGFRHPDKSARLKIAYLLAFHRLGYQLILEPKQVVNPSFKKIGNYLAGDLEFQESIPIVGLRDELAPISKGILGVVVSPIDYQCLVVNFSIGIKDKSPYNSYCVFLPNPTDENFENLLRLKKAIDAKASFNLQIESIDEHLEQQTNKLPPLWYHSLWQSIFERIPS